MKKIKGSGIITAAAFLSIGIFSAAFIAVNSLTLAAAAGKTESIPPVTATVNIPAAEPVMPEDYQQPDFTVYVPENKWYSVGANDLSAEEAAQIGALYIWDMFGESIDGKAVEMYYSAWDSHTRAYWHGYVADSFEDLKNNVMTDAMRTTTNPVYGFTICAASGERVDIQAVSNYVNIPALSELHNDMNRRDELAKLRSAQQPPERLDEYAQAAEAFAAKHFAGSEVVGVEFRNASAYSFDLDENGELFIATQQLLFTVTDSTGREAEVSISRESKALIRIVTQHNDVVPGYNHDTYGAG